MFTVEAIITRKDGSQAMFARDFKDLYEAKQIADHFRSQDGVEVTRFGEKVTHQPTWNDITMDGRYSCD